MPTKRSYLTLFALFLLVLISGCGSPSQLRSSGTQVPGPVGTSQVNIPAPAITVAGQVVPSPIPTIIPTSGPTFTPSWGRKVYGDTSEAQAIVEHWQAVALAIRSFHGAQVFMQVQPDGTRKPFPDDLYTNATGSDEWYDGLQTRDSRQIRYKVVFHNKRGDFTTLYNGAAAYRSWSWIPEVYRAWPDSFAPNAYWGDDIDDIAMLQYILPVGDSYESPQRSKTVPQYHLVGRKHADGRNLVELVLNQGNVIPNGMRGTHVYLDEATYLPYRYLVYSDSSNSSGKSTATERTFTKLEINGQVTFEDFDLKISPTTPEILEPAYMAPPMPSYKTLQEARIHASFTIFIPSEGVQGAIGVVNFVAIDGRTTPVLSYGRTTPVLSLSGDGASIEEGVYIPPDRGDIFALRFSDRLGDVQQKTETVDVGGQQAEWITSDHSQVLRLERNGTQIEISGVKTKEQAIEVAKGLKPVK